MTTKTILKTIGNHLWDNLYTYLFVISFFINISLFNYYENSEYCKMQIEHYSSLYATSLIMDEPTKEDSLAAFDRFNDLDFAELMYKIRVQSYKDTLNGWIEVNQSIKPFPFN